jgi:hypothetical protein
MEDYCQYQQRLMGVIAPSRSVLLPDGMVDVFLTLPGMTTLVGKTYLGLKHQAAVLSRHKRPLEALTLLISALRTQHFWSNHTKKWWRLMNTAVFIAQDLEPWTQKRFSEPLIRLLNLSKNAPQPWQGREVAYCFATLSLWSFQEGKTQKAIDKITTAIHADPSWGYSEYLLGWYGLLLEGIEPVPHFVRAIKIDGGLWQTLKQDPLLSHFPDVRLTIEQELNCS